MKPISQLKFEVHRNGKRIDKEILDVKFHEGMVCFTDKEDNVQWLGFPNKVEIYVE